MLLIISWRLGSCLWTGRFIRPELLQRLDICVVIAVVMSPLSGLAPIQRGIAPLAAPASHRPCLLCQQPWHPYKPHDHPPPCQGIFDFFTSSLHPFFPSSLLPHPSPSPPSQPPLIGRLFCLGRDLALAGSPLPHLHPPWASILGQFHQLSACLPFRCPFYQEYRTMPLHDGASAARPWATRTRILRQPRP
jgi:hypothetical protein